jgi:hypothetical protein
LGRAIIIAAATCSFRLLLSAASDVDSGCAADAGGAVGFGGDAGVAAEVG